MACGRSMLNLAIIVILIFIIFAMLYKGNIYKEPFHAHYNGIIENEARINRNSTIIKNSSFYDGFKSIFSRLMKVN